MMLSRSVPPSVLGSLPRGGGWWGREHGNPLPGPIDDADARLAYVAVNRARTRLDFGGLAWIHNPPTETPGRPDRSQRRWVQAAV